MSGLCEEEVASRLQRQGAVDAVDEEMRDVECNICYNPAEDNRRCKQCRHLFCRGCIQQWMSKCACPTCPTCRCVASEEAFEHDAQVDLVVGQRETACDICGHIVAYKALAKHRLVCMHEEVTCPFQGCTYRCTRSNMDIHTATCSRAQKYNLEEVIQQVCKRAAGEPPQYVNEHLLDNIYQPDDTADSETLVHYVQTHDTLSGLAVKYSCTREDIKRLNNLSYDTQLFSRSTIVVPRPPSWQPKEEPDVPLSVLVALRKKKLTRKVATQCRVPEEEAVAYLHLTHYKAGEAIRLIEEDAVWSLQHGERQPKTLKDFLQRKQRGLAPCTACSRPLHQETPRAHCASCGAFFCHRCHHGQGYCKRTVPKSVLGATNPETRHQHVRVCHTCFSQHTTYHSVPCVIPQHLHQHHQHHQQQQQYPVFATATTTTTAATTATTTPYHHHTPAHTTTATGPSSSSLPLC